MRLGKQVRQMLLFLQRENLLRILVVLVLLVLLGTMGLMLFEPKVSLVNAFWWCVVTLTTVGYGDITPTSVGGRLIGILIMFFGIGILGMFTATIASIFVERKLKEAHGMKSYDFEDHIILCEWNHRAAEIVSELRLDPQVETLPIVLIAQRDMKPIEDDQLFFIQDDVNEDSLKRANLAKAKTVIILGNDELDDSARDARVVLSTLTVESINPDAYTIVELVDGNNVRHCQRARANEIIAGSEFSSRLISRAALNHGISKVLSELLTSRRGNDLYKIPVPPSRVGHPFIEVFLGMKQAHQSIVLAVQKGCEGGVISNPPADLRVEEGDYLILIAAERPKNLS